MGERRESDGSMIEIDPAWPALLERLDADESWASVFVMGPIDSGKTTFCRVLGERLSRTHPTFAVDCDPGQSALGWPACMALAREPWNGGEPLALRFVGSTSPSGHFLQTLTGVNRLAEHAHECGAQRIIFDCCGYLENGGGREFHFQMLDLLQPDHVIALQGAGEIDPLLEIFERRGRPLVHRLPIPAAVVPRSTVERRAYRTQRFARYFETAVMVTLPLDDLGLHGMVPPPDRADLCRDRLVGLCDRRGFALAMGLVQDFEPGRNRLHLLAPPFRADAVVSVQFGSLRLDRHGREL